MRREDIEKTFTDSEKVEIILSELKKKNISQEELAVIQGWLVSDVSVQEKEYYLNKLFDECVNDSQVAESWVEECLSQFSELVGKPVSSFRPTKPVVTVRKRRRVSARTRSTVAAAVLVPMFVVSLFMYGNSGGFDRPDTSLPAAQLTEVVLKTGNLVNRAVTLPDGSVVKLGDDTELTYFSDFADNRVLHLNGEAFFSVAQLGGLPFVVETDNLNVTALGTEFNVKAYPEMEQTVVSLTSGKVKVESQTEELVLAPMEQLVFNKNSGDVAVDQFDEVLAEKWLNGKKELRGMLLPDALSTAATFFDVNLETKGKAPLDKFIDITLFATLPVDVVLGIMQFITDDAFSFDVNNDLVTITYNNRI